MSVKVQVLEHGYELHQATEGASAFDIRNTFEGLTIKKGKTVKVPLGFKTAIPSGKVGIVSPRSGLGSKGMQIANTVGVIDSDYRGEWLAVLTLADWCKDEEMVFAKGDRILQVMFVDAVVVREVECVESLDGTERGDGAYGSTGV